MSRRTALLAALTTVLGLATAVIAQEPRRPGPGGRPPGPPPQAGASERLEKPPMARDATETKILSLIEELDSEQARRGMMNVPQNDGRLLRILAESIGAKRVVELGTSNGYSGLWFSLALLKTDGHLFTFDIDEGRSALARKHFEQAGVLDRITMVLGDAHETAVAHDYGGPIDLLFIDADKEGYLDYLNKLLPKVRPGGLILSHNMSRPRPDPKFVEAITTNPELETLFVHMDEAGMAVTLKKR